jgi:hypothetical protein
MASSASHPRWDESAAEQWKTEVAVHFTGRELHEGSQEGEDEHEDDGMLIRILAPIVGVRRKKDEEAEKDITKQNRAVLVGFRSTYVFDRLSRDLRPAWPATVLRRGAPRSCVRLDGSSHIIAQFAGSLQGGLNTDEFQLTGGDLSGGFVVSLCCV